MLTNQWVRVATMGAIVTLAAGGCLRRKETITVSANGSVTISLAYEGEPREFETTDAMPGEASGWRTRRDKQVDENGKERETLTAEREFAAGEDLPSSYADKGSPNADLALSFPTTVKKEKRADGVYVHFRRVFQPRLWAYVQLWQDQGFDDSIKKLAEKPLEELTHEERVQLVKAFAGVEMYKHLEFAREALRECDPEIPQDVWLKAREALMKVVESQEWDAFVDTVAALAEKEREATLDRESQRIIEESMEAFAKSLRHAGEYDEGKIGRFEAAFDRAKKRYAITNETGGHGFEIHVQMPGEIVAHNADKLEDGVAEWEFDGSAFRDRPYELMITSKLPRERAER